MKAVCTSWKLYMVAIAIHMCEWDVRYVAFELKNLALDCNTHVWVRCKRRYGCWERIRWYCNTHVWVRCKTLANGSMAVGNCNTHVWVRCKTIIFYIMISWCNCNTHVWVRCKNGSSWIQNANNKIAIHMCEWDVRDPTNMINKTANHCNTHVWVRCKIIYLIMLHRCWNCNTHV